MARPYPLVLLLAGLLLFVPRAEAAKCDSCEFEEVSVRTLEAYDGSRTARVCDDCLVYARRCWVCHLPCYKKFKLHEDKRVFCHKDYAEGVFEHSDMPRMVLQTKDDLERLFYRFQMKFSNTNVTCSLVSAATIYDVLKAPFNPQSANIAGLTVTTCYDQDGKEVKMDERHKQPAGSKLRYEHEIYLAAGHPADRLKGVLIHEMTHVWLNENLAYKRFDAIDRHTMEGFCELVAYQLLEQENSVHAKNAIRRNLYTMGQQNILIEIDQGYGFNRILQWLHHGTGRRLETADLVRQVQVPPTSLSSASAPAPASAPISNTATAVAAAAPVAKPYSEPRSVILKGVMWGKKKSVMINGSTFMEGDEQSVKLADGRVTVKCVEIRPASAILVVNGEQKEFFVGDSN